LTQRNETMKPLTTEERHYLAGFLDADGSGSIFAQLVRGDDLKYKYRIRVSIGFYQNKRYNWFLENLQKDLKCGSIRTKNDGVTEYIITGTDPVKNLLLQLKDCLVLKKRQANLVLEILEQKKQIKSKADFLKVCQLTDKVAMLNYSKKRTITTKEVEKALFSDRMS
jgi:hypothetical protein